MNGIWLEDFQLSFRSNVPIPDLPQGEVLIKVTHAGICSTDLELVKGYYPFKGILGHEFVGKVVESPSNPEWCGKRVVGEINAACGFCPACIAGRSTHCSHRTVLGISHRNGAFAEYLTLPEKNLHKVPEAIPDTEAVFTEPLAAAMEIITQVHIKPEDHVLLVGAGRLGLLIAQVLRWQPSVLRVLIRNEFQEQILSHLGIETIRLEQLDTGHYDVVIEATGTVEGFHIARSALRSRGILILKSTYHGDIQINLSSLVVDEITIIGSRCGPFEPAIKFLLEDKVSTQPLITASYPLSDALLAFEHAAKKGVLKVLFEIE